MALTNAFYEAVESKNIQNIRIMMKNSLLFDRTFEEFHAMEKAAASVEGLYDKHDGGELLTDKNAWNDDYMNKMMVKVIFNFSHERLAHLQEVVRYLRPASEETVSKQEPSMPYHGERIHQSSYQEEKRRCQERGDYRGAKIGAGAIAGAAVGGVVVSAAGASAAGVVGGIAAGAAIGGAAIAVIVNIRRK